MCRRCCGVALDMGSARTRAWIAGQGVVVDVPTVASPGTGAVHPIQRGTIVDAQAALGSPLPSWTASPSAPMRVPPWRCWSRAVC